MRGERFSGRVFDARGRLDELGVRCLRIELERHGALHVTGTGLTRVEEVVEVLPALGFGPSQQFSLGGRTAASTQEKWAAPGLRRLDYYPPDLYLLANNEVQYRRASPRWVLFACLGVAPSGGRIFLHSARAVEAELARRAPILLERMVRHGVSIETGFLDARHPEKASNTFQSWQERFETDDADEAMRRASAASDEHDQCWWGPEQTLMTCITLAAKWGDGFLRFPRVALDGPAARNGLRRFPLGDGSSLTPDEEEVVRSVLLETREGVAQRAGDLVLFDNVRFGHSRESFTGERNVLVAMAGEVRASSASPESVHDPALVTIVDGPGAIGQADSGPPMGHASSELNGDAFVRGARANHGQPATVPLDPDASTLVPRARAVSVRAGPSHASNLAGSSTRSPASSNAHGPPPAEMDRVDANDGASLPVLDETASVGRAASSPILPTESSLGPIATDGPQAYAFPPELVRRDVRFSVRVFDGEGTLNDARSAAIRREFDRHGAVLVQNTGIEVEHAGALPTTILAALGFSPNDSFPWGGMSSGRTTRRALSPELRATDEYPPHLWLLPHNEVLYQRTIPARLLFFSARDVEPDQGGRTFVHEAAALERFLVTNGGTSLLDGLRRHGLLIEMGFVDEGHPERHLNFFRSWQERFATTDRAEAARRCRAATHQFDECWWKDEGGGHATLMTRIRVPAFCGRSLLFPRIALDPPSVRNGHRRYPRGDGRPFTRGELDLLLHGFLETREGAQWRAGDLLLCDNVRYGHSREAFSGTRSLAVAMAGVVDVGPPP